MPNKKVVLVCGGVLLLLATAAQADVPRKLQGKAFFSLEPIKDQALPALVKTFSKAQEKVLVPRNKKKTWQLDMVAFFRKNAIPGPITIWLYDLKDKEALKANEPVHLFSVDSKPSKTFVHNLTIDPDLGFNKGRNYLIRVGQIIKGRPKIYASGQLTLGE